MLKFFIALTLTFSATLSFSNEKKIITLNEDNHINFNNEFTGQFVGEKQIEASKKCYKNPNSDIYVVLYTPGGSVSAGKLFFDILNALPCNFHTITIFSASMGYQTVQNLKGRYILPSGILMSHRAYVSGLGGEVDGELDEIIKLLKRNIGELNQIAAKRAGISLEKYEEDISDELWMTGSQAVEMNHADEQILVKCDSSLFEGTNESYLRTIFGSVKVNFSKCPIITSPVNVSGDDKAVDFITKKYMNLSNYVVWRL